MTGEGEEEDLESKTPVTPDAPDALKGLFEKRRTVLAVIVSDSKAVKCLSRIYS